MKTNEHAVSIPAGLPPETSPHPGQPDDSRDTVKLQTTTGSTASGYTWLGSSDSASGLESAPGSGGINVRMEAIKQYKN